MSHMEKFEKWLKAVDAWVFKLIGLSYQDLPDLCYDDLFESGMSPKAAAKYAIKSAGE